MEMTTWFLIFLPGVVVVVVVVVVDVVVVVGITYGD